MLIEITDQAGTSGTVTADHLDAADTITPWYPEAPAEVTQAISDLQGALNRHENTEAIAEYLGILITEA